MSTLSYTYLRRKKRHGILLFGWKIVLKQTFIY